LHRGNIARTVRVEATLEEHLKPISKLTVPKDFNLMQFKSSLLKAMILSLALTGFFYWDSTNVSSSLPPQPTTTPSSSPYRLPAPVQNLSTPLASSIETYTSSVMGGHRRTYGVVLPPNYDNSPHQHYPVIFLLHGGSGGPTDWLNPQKGDVLTTLRQLYSEGKLLPSIVITPDGNDKRGSSPYRDPQYIDGPNGNVLTAIGQELVQVVQSRYRTLPAPTYWAIGGLSSGGWGAVNIGLHNLNRFAVLFSHSGYFIDRSGTQNSPMQFIQSIPTENRQHLRIYLDSGTADKFYIDQAKAFHDKLNQIGIANLLNPFPGTHSWRYWRQHLTDSLTYVNEQFQNAR
jgi:enterochelin esterase-like enzyme